MPQSETPVWLITGCSTGLGRALAELVVKHGWRVIVTAREAARVKEIVKGVEDRGLALALDVTRPEQIAAVVAAAKEKFGRIDVLVSVSERDLVWRRATGGAPRLGVSRGLGAALGRRPVI